MNRLMFAENPFYQEFEQGVQKLNRLIAEGKGDTDEADEVRDSMDGLYRRLSSKERDRLSGLSADLYMLQDDEIYEALDSGQTQADLETEVKSAWQRQDMESLLRLLRKGPVYLSREGVASLRAYAYQKLGHLESALAFQEYAAELNPQEIGHKIRILDLLYALKRREAAADQARKIIADPKASPDMVAVAGYVLSQTASPIPEEQGENSFATAQRKITSELESLVTAA